MNVPQVAFTCSKSAMGTEKQGMKSIQSSQFKQQLDVSEVVTDFTYYSGVSIVYFKQVNDGFVVR